MLASIEVPTRLSASLTIFMTAKLLRQAGKYLSETGVSAAVSATERFASTWSDWAAL